MTRAKVVKYLTEMLNDPDATVADTKVRSIHWEHSLREAIALLQPTDDTEIEAARDYVRGIFMLAKTDAALVGLAENDPGLAVEHEKAAHMIASVLDRALDALAREPKLEVEVRDLDDANHGLGETINNLRGTALTLTSRNIELEARLARVRELLTPPKDWSGDDNRVRTITVGKVLDALAADAGPEVK